MPSPELEAFIRLRAQMPQPPADAPPPDITVRRAGFDMAAPPLPDTVKTVAVSAEGVPGEWVLSPGVDHDRRLLLLHGGAYAFGSTKSHRRFASDLGVAANCAVLAIDYRLAPENVWPAQLEDALSAWDWMQANGPGGAAPARSLYLAGDSAGGGLTLALLLALRDAGRAQPNAAATFSAWTDLAVTSPSMRSRRHRDPIITNGAEGVRQAVAVVLGGMDPCSPSISPAYGDFTGIAPLYLNAGDDEVLLDDTLRVAARAGEAGVDVVLHVQPGGFHVYPMFVPDAPESRLAMNAAGEFFRRKG